MSLGYDNKTIVIIITWSIDSGSLALFSCMFGLHTPCSQYLHERMIASLVLSHLSPAQPLQVPILPVLQQLLVELVLVLGVERECEAIPRHCWPASNLQQAALVILRHQVAQHCPVVDESIQWSGILRDFYYNLLRDFLVVSFAFSWILALL